MPLAARISYSHGRIIFLLVRETAHATASTCTYDEAQIVEGQCSNMINYIRALLTTIRFQMVSLLKLAQVTEEGVRFLSPHDGTPM